MKPVVEHSKDTCPTTPSPDGRAASTDAAVALDIDYLRFVDGTLDEWHGIRDEAAFRILADGSHHT